MTKEMLKKWCSDITNLRNLFLLPVNDPEYSETAHTPLHQGLYDSEMLEGILAENQEKRMDALVDAIYVVVGKLVHRGHTSLGEVINLSKTDYDKILTILFINDKLFDLEKFHLSWDIIHASNLSKLCYNKSDRDLTLTKYRDLGIYCKAYKTGDAWVVKATKDGYIGTDFVPKGKFLKSVSYTKADLSPVFV